MGCDWRSHDASPPVTRVEVIRPERGTIRRTTVQPGQIEAYEVTAIFAKVSGYVHNWNVDIGTKVTKGQELAVLTVPELDAEAEQKQATVEESQAKLAQARASEEVAQADLASAEAKLIQARAGIKRVILPARNRHDLEDIPRSTRDALEFVWVDNVAQALKAALGPEVPAASVPTSMASKAKRSRTEHETEYEEALA